MVLINLKRYNQATIIKILKVSYFKIFNFNNKLTISYHFACIVLIRIELINFNNECNQELENHLLYEFHY